MGHYESRININGEWRTLLVVESETACEFADSITFERGTVIETYLVNGVYRDIITDGKHIYWFLPTAKNIMYVKDDVARESVDVLNALLGVTEE